VSVVNETVKVVELFDAGTEAGWKDIYLSSATHCIHGPACTGMYYTLTCITCRLDTQVD